MTRGKTRNGFFRHPITANVIGILLATLLLSVTTPLGRSIGKHINGYFSHSSSAFTKLPASGEVRPHTSATPQVSTALHVSTVPRVSTTPKGATASREIASSLATPLSTPSKSPVTLIRVFTIHGAFLDGNGRPIPIQYKLESLHGEKIGILHPLNLANGSFKIDGVPNGEYFFEMDYLKKYFGLAYIQFRRIKISGSDLNLGKIVSPYSRVFGSVVDGSGNPVRAQYWLTDARKIQETDGNIFSMSNGEFRTAAVFNGTYTLHIEASGYRPFIISVIVSGQDVSVGRVMLEPSP